MSSVFDKNYLRRLVDGNYFSHQEEDYLAIMESVKKKEKKALIQMFCGTGKTRVIFKCANDSFLTIIVFPTIQLGKQFAIDYVERERKLSKYGLPFDFLSICSDAQSTTDPLKIKTFLASAFPKKIISVTYDSYELLCKIICDEKIVVDKILYDEAHHITGSQIQKFVFDSSLAMPCNFQGFFSATPKNGSWANPVAGKCPFGHFCPKPQRFARARSYSNQIKFNSG